MVWRDFDSVGCSGLHEGASCELHLYHTNAGIIAGKARPDKYQVVSERLWQVNLRI